MSTLIIDYGSGNLRSVAKAVESVGGDPDVTDKPKKLAKADRIILPGVGAFADCRANLDNRDLVEPITEHINAGRPFLGICVGMQLLFSESHEFGTHPGLDLIPGTVDAFSKKMSDPEDNSRHLKVPHMGWNRVSQTQEKHPLWAEIPDASHFYFVHSFHGVASNKEEIAGMSDYGIPFVAAVARNNLFATQFHPEKSQKFGLQLLKNFLAWKP
ncbi:MAG: imidazole glycerol phosphate synthase subunit HisH [Magnetococcales bacterium]|nr:imidazole glycerol phosphate synthase subunit HisH [Magnetococcales bacterium]